MRQRRIDNDIYGFEQRNALAFLDILENHFTSKEAQRQLRTAMDWGRYAELFSYDEPSGEIFIEEKR